MSEQELVIGVDSARVADLLRQLTEELAATGAVRSPEWRSAFERTPRHLFVPRFSRRAPSGREWVDGSQPEQREAWLAGVYTDEALTIQCGEGDPRIATSSSTQPTLMALMLEALDIADGHCVLEVGTGTGYNAALLCERLGSDLVTTIDIDPRLVDHARQRLCIAGYTPTVAVADGASGYPPNAPYDRILATCSVTHVPRAWIAQTRPGGLILMNLSGGFGGGLVRIEVLPDGSAVGRFLADPAYFMAMRGSTAPKPPLAELIFRIRGEGSTRAVSVPHDIEDETARFLAGLALPHVVRFGYHTPTTHSAPCLVDLHERSWARLDRTPEGGTTVTQGGKRKLWDELESAHERWLELGKPTRDRYGLTVTADGRQHVWLDSPHSEHTWDLPLPD